MIVPDLSVDIDFEANPTASYADLHSTLPEVVSFWRLNSTSTVDDERGNNDGVMVSTPATIAGPYPYDDDLGLTFDGAADSAYVEGSASLAPGTFSISGWVRVSSLPGSTVDLVSRRGSWVFQLNSSGKVLFSLCGDNTFNTITSNSVLSTNTWYHLCGVYDGATGYLYINGQLDKSAAHSATIEAPGLPIVFAGRLSTTAPAWQNTQSASGSGTTFTCTKPASTASGDLLIAQISTRGGSDPAFTFNADGSGVDFEQLAAVIPDSNQTDAQLWAKVATGSEPASYSWSSSSSVTGYQVAISRITGQNTIEWLANPVYSVVDAPGGATVSTGTHLPHVHNSLILAFFMNRTTGTWTQDSGTERYDAAGGFTSQCMCSQTQTTPASLNVTGTSSSSGFEGAAFYVVVNGTGVDETSCSLDDWAFWDEALTDAEVGLVYETRNGGEGSWTAVELKAQSFQLQGGSRQYERDAMQAGGLQIALLDTDRRFDPTNIDGTHYPDVLPMRRIRGQATWDGVTYPLWEQYVTSWPQEKATPSIHRATLNAVDGFDLLARADVHGELEIDLTGAQISEILNKAAWPLDKRAIDTGQYACAGQTLNTTALSAIQDLADSERGIFFIDVDGTATFHDSIHRSTDSRSTTSQATFTDYAGGIPYIEIEPVFDRSRIINRWDVSPDASVPDGEVQSVADPVSRGKFGFSVLSRSTKLLSNEAALEQARLLLADTAWPTRRFESMTVVPTTDLAWEACLGLRVSDLITVKIGTNPETWTGDTITQECFVEGMDLFAVPGGPWRFTFKLSPRTNGNYMGATVLMDPVSYWRMDVNT